MQYFSRKTRDFATLVLRRTLEIGFLRPRLMPSRRLNRLLYVVISAIALSPGALLPMGCSQAPQQALRIDVTMKKYEINPPEIRIKQGEPVEFHVTATDVQHGFDVPELGIKESVQPSRPAVFTFTPDRKGDFEVKCGILCGAGHDRMRGKVIVE
jgi:heme/copper-type cytochrome/quinol oxidase subunit 2